jgi:ribonuclease-3
VVAVRNSIQSPVDGDPLTATPAGAEAIVEHRFRDPALLCEALTHRSASESRGRARGVRKGSGSNERLEFLGDRVLGLLMAEWLIERFPEEQEGDLGRRLAHLVSGPTAAAAAEAVGLPEALAIAPGEVRAGVRDLATVRGDAMEAVIGALYLDGGLDVARRFVRRAFAGAIDAQVIPPRDPKSALQEWALGRAMPLPKYTVASRTGPSHDPVFVVEVSAAGRSATGTAGSKRLAEREAASALLRELT